VPRRAVEVQAKVQAEARAETRVRQGAMEILEIPSPEA
jgi:hypothetical protein